MFCLSCDSKRNEGVVIVCLLWRNRWKQSLFLRTVIDFPLPSAAFVSKPRNERHAEGVSPFSFIPRGNYGVRKIAPSKEQRKAL
jgi:hypothetical protein